MLNVNMKFCIGSAYNGQWQFYWDEIVMEPWVDADIVVNVYVTTT